MIKNKDFLDEWVRLETLLRKDGSSKTPLDYEAELNADDAEKLKVCRIMRNYNRHHQDGDSFLQFSQEQKDFIESLNEQLELKFESVKSKTKKVTPIQPTDNLQTVAIALSKVKSGFLPVVDKKGTIIGIIDSELLVYLLGNGTKLTAKVSTFDTASAKWKAKFKEAKIIDFTPELETLKLGARYIVVDKGAYRGVIVW